MARRKKQQKVIENVAITGIAAKAKGVAKIDGKVHFIDDGIPGDIANIRIIKNKSDYANAKIQEIVKPSEDRIEPFCKHFTDCGGCKWQYLAYENQLKYKAQIVADNFERIAKEADIKPLPIEGCETDTFYRNKMEYSFSHTKWRTRAEIESEEILEDEPSLGFHVPGFFDKIVNVEKCWLQDDFANGIRNEVRNFAIKNGLSFWNIRKQTGLLRNLIIRNTTLGEWMIVVIFSKNDADSIESLMQNLTKQFPKVNSFSYVVNGKANDTIYDLPVHNYLGEEFITEQIGELKFRITAKSFFQTNSKQANTLYKITKDFAGLSGDEVVYDLYSGTGTIGLFLSDNAKKIVGIETVEEAVNAANENKLINNITNASFYKGEVRKVFDEVSQREGKADVVIIDPPRMGLHPKVIDQLLHIEAKKLVYVSCNPATQARDVLLLKEKYNLEKLQPVDMFPHTHHIENVALLVLKN